MQGKSLWEISWGVVALFSVPSSSATSAPRHCALAAVTSEVLTDQRRLTRLVNTSCKKPGQILLLFIFSLFAPTSSNFILIFFENKLNSPWTQGVFISEVPTPEVICPHPPLSSVICSEAIVFSFLGADILLTPHVCRTWRAAAMADSNVMHNPGRIFLLSTEALIRARVFWIYFYRIFNPTLWRQNNKKIPSRTF